MAGGDGSADVDRGQGREDKSLQGGDKAHLEDEEEEGEREGQRAEGGDAEQHRQPEMKDELQAIRWLGFALTEAVAFYTFIFGLIAFFL